MRDCGEVLGPLPISKPKSLRPLSPGSENAAPHRVLVVSYRFGDLAPGHTQKIKTRRLLDVPPCFCVYDPFRGPVSISGPLSLCTVQSRRYRAAVRREASRNKAKRRLLNTHLSAPVQTFVGAYF